MASTVLIFEIYILIGMLHVTPIVISNALDVAERGHGVYYVQQLQTMPV